MTTTHRRPADTRMMGIVHRALKRDLIRAREVLRSLPAPADRQRVALATHVSWVLDVLHAHHTGEDEGLWPLVRDRNPAAAPLIDSMEADHRRIAPAVDVASTAARSYATSSSDAARVGLHDALEALLDVLIPHLDREVAEAMPVVAASITDREWELLDQRFNIKPKSKRQLAMEGHWLIEDLDAEGYEIVVHKVPPVLRFILLHGFGHAYRRAARQRWTPVRPTAGMPA